MSYLSSHTLIYYEFICSPLLSFCIVCFYEPFLQNAEKAANLTL